MPIYATVPDISRTISPEILIQLADDDQDQQWEDPVVEDAIDRAEGLVNAALGAAGYAIPVALPIPKGAEVIKGATVWLAICDLAARRGVVPEDYKGQCELYRGILDQIRMGKLGLPLPAGTINMPQSSTLGQQRRMDLSKFDIGEDADAPRNPEEDHTLDVV